MHCPTPTIRWISEEYVSDRLAFRIGRCESELFAEFPEAGTLVANERSGVGRFVPVQGADPVLVGKIEHGLVPALLRQLKGKLALHAATAACNGRAVACFGASHSGKSTAVAELCARPGVELVADDATALELRDDRAEVVPTDSEHWLWPASCEALGVGDTSTLKIPVAASAAARSPARLVALCSLVFVDGLERPELIALRGHALVQSLVGALIRLVIDNPERQVTEFEQMTTLAARARVYELRRARDLGRLRETGDILEGLLRSGDPAERSGILPCTGA